MQAKFFGVLGHHRRPLLTTMVSALLLSTGCGGASEDRVAELERQMQALKAPGEVDVEALQDHMAGFETSVNESLYALGERVEVLEKRKAPTTSAPSVEAPPFSQKPKATPKPQPSKVAEAPPVAAVPQAAQPVNSSNPGSAMTWHQASTVVGAESFEVESDGEGSYEVSLAWLQLEVAKLAIVGRGPRIARNKKGGLSLKGVKPKSTLGRLGFKNGDTITRIGGTEVNTPDELIEAIKSSPLPLSIELERKRNTLTFSYGLRK